MFHNTTPDLKDQDRFFLSQTSLVLRPTVSDHITALEHIILISTLVTVFTVRVGEHNFNVIIIIIVI